MRAFAVLGLAVCLSGCAGPRVYFSSPEGDQLILKKKSTTIVIPSTVELPRGKHKAEFVVSRDHARDLGLSESFTLYGYLTVGAPTENSSLTDLVMEIPDDLILAAKQEGRVLEAVIYDDGAGGKVLVSLKLGERRPDGW